MLVSELRSKLLEILEVSGLDRREKLKIKGFLAALAQHDLLSVEALRKMFHLAPLTKRVRKPVEVVRHPAASGLRAVMQDDIGFERALDAVAADKKVTIGALLGIYEVLFDTLDGVPAKISRSELLDLIRRERTKSVRNFKVHGYLSTPKRPQ